MAITWRNVDAPQFDMRSMFQASQGLDQSFSRFGDMLNKREETLRTEATDAALAQGYAAQDPEAVAAMMAKGVGGMGPRVNSREVMESMAKYKSDLIDSGFKNEQRLTLQDAAEKGGIYTDWFSKMGKGDRAGADAVLAANPGLRNWATYAPQGNELAGQSDARAEDIRNHNLVDGNADADRASRERQEAANRAQSASQHSQRMGLAWQEYKDAKGREAQRDAMANWGSTASKGVPLNIAPEQATLYAQKLLQQQGVPQKDWDTALKSFDTAYKVRSTATGLDLQRQVGGVQPALMRPVPGTGGAPAFMIPGSVQGQAAIAGSKRNSLRDVLGGVPDYLTKDQQGVASESVMSRLNSSELPMKQTQNDLGLIQDDFLRQKPDFAVYKESSKYKDITPKDVLESAKTLGVKTSVERAMARGLQPSEAMALLKYEQFQTDQVNPFETGRPGKNFDEMAERYKSERPNFSKYEVDLQGELTPYRELINQQVAQRQVLQRLSAGEEGPSLTDMLVSRMLEEKATNASKALRSRKSSSK